MEPEQIKVDITMDEMNRAGEIISRIRNYYVSKMVGQEQLGVSLLVSMIANGHILLESVPGLAKTTAAKVVTEAVNGQFSRIQCTPDLLPSDIIGTQTFNMTTNTFETKLGPVYANFVLLDEVNRSSAKTQSAMLEAMQEKSTSIGGRTYKLPDVFIVVATQNPIEQEGTYVLSEAQLDRFLLKEVITYPTVDQEVEILNRVEAEIFNAASAVATLDDVVFLQNLCKKIYVAPTIKKYIVDVVQASRDVEKVIPPDLASYVAMGASTRAAIAFMEVAKAVALISGRAYCTPDDVKALRYEVLRHRIMLNFAAVADGVKEEKIIDAIFGAVPTP
ncbi:MAG: MoxR family ATPase [Saccharofermentans sp.]|nr:MoxR family ATPase [Saccharofermentans sp.]